VRKKITYNEFLANISIQYELQDPPHQVRYGQMYMDAMNSVNPRIAKVLWNSVNDPYQRDNVPPHVHRIVEDQWSI